MRSILVLWNVRENLADLSREFQSDRLAISYVGVVVIHFRQSHDLFEQPARRVVSMMVNQFPGFRDVPARKRAEVRHVSHGVEEIRFPVYLANCASQRWIRSCSEESDTQLLNR